MALVVARADDATQKANTTPYAAELNKKWADPKADVRKFIKSLESEKRIVFAKRHAITSAVGLRPAMRSPYWGGHGPRSRSRLPSKSVVCWTRSMPWT